MITFCAERFADEYEALKPMFVLHWQELALNKDVVPLDPQYNVYLERENRGEVMFITARESGSIVGYFIGFVAPGLHYQTCLTLTMDIFWIHPEKRGNMTGVNLFRFIEQEARNRGVQRMFMGSKLHKDVGWLFERLGYTEVERYFSKMVGA